MSSSSSCSLLDVLDAIPDPRSPLGLRHPLSALLGLLVVAFAANCNTMTAIVSFGRSRPDLRRRLGFKHPKSPSQSTYCRLFERLSIEALRTALVQWLASATATRKDTVASVDGKTMRGTGDHYLHVFLQEYWTLVDLFEVDAKHNEHSAFEAQLDAFVQRHPCITLLTFDAIFCQHTIAEKLVGNGKKAIFQVKGNQPETLWRLQRFFSSLAKDKPDHQSEEKKKQVYCTA
jgi:hypothetical protein